MTLKRDFIKGIGIITLLLVISPFFEHKTKEELTKAAFEEAECRKTLECYGRKYFIDASVYCRRQIEKLAKYSSKWTDERGESKFDSVGWLDQTAGTLTFTGDKVQFQNGFGAYKNIEYECDLDPSTHTVLNVRLNNAND